METKLILEDFLEHRKLLQNLRENMATPRLKGMWNFLYKGHETISIIFRIPPVDRLIRKATPDTPLQAGDPKEVVGIGLYIMKECSETTKHITEIIHDLGIGSREGKPTRQSYVDEAMFGYINPALDFIERELEELAKTKEKPTAPRKSRVKDAGLSDETADEATIEEASIAAYNIPDQPTRYDALGFEPYTTAISEFLSHEDTKPPLTLSIEGDWGVRLGWLGNTGKKKSAKKCKKVSKSVKNCKKVTKNVPKCAKRVPFCTIFFRHTCAFDSNHLRS